MTRDDKIAKLRAQIANLEEPSLFNEVEDVRHEVPQSTFLSWPREMQLAYCAARDEDSARRADTEEDAAWYRGRAAMYKEMIDGKQHQRQTDS